MTNLITAIFLKCGNLTSWCLRSWIVLSHFCLILMCLCWIFHCRVQRAFSVNIIHSFRAEDHVVGFVLTPLKVENVMEGVRRWEKEVQIADIELELHPMNCRHWHAQRLGHVWAGSVGWFETNSDVRSWEEEKHFVMCLPKSLHSKVWPGSLGSTPVSSLFFNLLSSFVPCFPTDLTGWSSLVSSLRCDAPIQATFHSAHARSYNSHPRPDCPELTKSDTEQHSQFLLKYSPSSSIKTHRSWVHEPNPKKYISIAVAIRSLGRIEAWHSETNENIRRCLYWDWFVKIDIVHSGLFSFFPRILREPHSLQIES